RGPVIPVYVLDDETPRHRKMGAVSRWWLHHSLKSLDRHLREKGSRLILRRGNAVKVLADIANKAGGEEIHALHHYEPWWLDAEKNLQAALGSEKALILHDGNYLLPPGAVTTGSGEPYKIFTPFWKSLRTLMPPSDPVPEPQKLDTPLLWPIGD